MVTWNANTTHKTFRKSGIVVVVVLTPICPLTIQIALQIFLKGLQYVAQPKAIVMNVLEPILEQAPAQIRVVVVLRVCAV
jgi:hypothetical protein